MTTESSPVRVLSNPGTWRDGDNPFLRLLLGSYDDTVEVVPFTWRRALGRDYDVLHVHWLEYLLRSDTAMKRGLKRFLFALLMVRLVLGQTAAIWTVHNETPHDDSGSRIEGLLLRAWSRVVSHQVFLTQEAAHAGRPGRSSVILHGHYRPVLAQSPRPRLPRQDAGTILHFGHVRPYKGIELLLDAYSRGWDTDGVHPGLSVVGRPADPAYGETIRRLAFDVPGVDLELRFLDDAELEGRIAASDLVVLPYTRMLNSGAALLALSVGRPILVPDSPSMRELRTEVGAAWVHLFTPPFDTAALSGYAEMVAGCAGALPNLSARDWAPIGAEYSRLFADLARRRRQPQRS